MELTEVFTLEDRIKEKVLIPNGVSDTEFFHHVKLGIAEHKKLFSKSNAYLAQHVINYLQRQWGYGRP